MATLPPLEALQRAVAHHQSGRFEQAEAQYREILAHYPNEPDALHLLGLVAEQLGRGAESEQLIRQSIAAAPMQCVYPNSLGKFLVKYGRHAEAIEQFRRAVQLSPTWVQGWLDLAMTLEAIGHADQAMEPYNQVLRLTPGNALALARLAAMHQARGDHREAERLLKLALSHDPNRIELMGNLACALEAQARYAEALDYLAAALKIAPDHFMLHFNMGVSLRELGRHKEADAAYERSIKLKPDFVPAYNNRGNTLKALGRFDEAIAAYRRALELEPNAAEAHSNLAAIHSSRAEHALAMQHDRRAMELHPDHAQILSNMCYIQLFYPDSSTAGIAAALRVWNNRIAVPQRALRKPHANTRNPDRRLRIGYVSPNFSDHVVGRNMIPALRHQDRADFEIYCYSNLAQKDATTGEFQKLSDRWRDIWGVADALLVEQIRADGIDILVDLALHMERNRLTLFTYRPAPIQATFAGYPGSTGLETMDYRITDVHLEPPQSEALWVEESLRLQSFWCYDPLGAALRPNPLPAAATGAVTFGCLNHFCKVNDGVLDVWAQVLRAVPRSRLLLMSSEGSHRGRTIAYLAQHGVAAEQISFYPWRPRMDYLALYHQIDLGLDTLPYNGHTTSLDSLWMGVPVVTQVGATEVGRAGLSQLTNLGLPELIADTPAQFVQLAIDLAHDLPRLAAYRATLRARMENSILMDAPAFARSLDAAYRQMWRHWCQNASHS